MDFLIELCGFIKERRKFWFIPVLAALLGFGALIAFTSGSALAPFLYALF